MIAGTPADAARPAASRINAYAAYYVSQIDSQGRPRPAANFCVMLRSTVLARPPCHMHAGMQASEQRRSPAREHATHVSSLTCTPLSSEQHAGRYLPCMNQLAISCHPASDTPWGDGGGGRRRRPPRALAMAAPMCISARLHHLAMSPHKMGWSALPCCAVNWQRTRLGQVRRGTRSPRQCTQGSCFSASPAAPAPALAAACQALTLASLSPRGPAAPCGPPAACGAAR